VLISCTQRKDTLTFFGGSARGWSGAPWDHSLDPPLKCPFILYVAKVFTEQFANMLLTYI